MAKNPTNETFNASAGGSEPPVTKNETVRLAARPVSRVQIMILQGHLSRPGIDAALTPMGSVNHSFKEERDRQIRGEIKEQQQRLGLRNGVAREAFARHAPDKNNDKGAGM